MTQTSDPHHIDRQVRQIRAQASAVLTKWGLLPRFKRWRLTQDPETGMVVLFGILNNSYIASHTSIPFNDYFDPRLLRDLANELQVEVVSCNSDGLRYAFILDRGQLGRLPTHIDYPFIDDGRVVVRVVYQDAPPSMPAPPPETTGLDDQTLVRQGVGAFLKVFDDIKVNRDEAALQLPSRALPQVVVIDEEQFKKRVAEHEASRQRRRRIDKLFERPPG